MPDAMSQTARNGMHLRRALRLPPDTYRAAIRQRTLMQSQNPRYGMQDASRACLEHIPEHPARAWDMWSPVTTYG